MTTPTIHPTLDAVIALLDEEIRDESAVLLRRWIDRDDGVAVYSNHDLGSSEIGHTQFVSFGSPAAQIESPSAPTQLPDIGNAINWRYALDGLYRNDVTLPYTVTTHEREPRLFVCRVEAGVPLYHSLHPTLDTAETTAEILVARLNKAAA